VVFCNYFDGVINLSKLMLWLKVLLDLRPEYESLEPLIDFLAPLVPKLCQKFQIFLEFDE